MRQKLETILLLTGALSLTGILSTTGCTTTNIREKEERERQEQQQAEEYLTRNENDNTTLPPEETVPSSEILFFQHHTPQEFLYDDWLLPKKEREHIKKGGLLRYGPRDYYVTFKQTEGTRTYTLKKHSMNNDTTTYILDEQLQVLTSTWIILGNEAGTRKYNQTRSFNASGTDSTEEETREQQKEDRKEVQTILEQILRCKKE